MRLLNKPAQMKASCAIVCTAMHNWLASSMPCM